MLEARRDAEKQMSLLQTSSQNQQLVYDLLSSLYIVFLTKGSCDIGIKRAIKFSKRTSMKIFVESESGIDKLWT